MTINTEEIKSKWKKLKSYQPELSSFNIAEKLKISQLELFLSALDEGFSIIRNDFNEIFDEIKNNENLKISVRNKSCVVESKSGFMIKNQSENDFTEIQNHDISLLIQTSKIKACIAVKSSEDTSIRFFDKYGDCVLRFILNSTDDISDEFFDKFKTNTFEIDFEIEKYCVQSGQILTEFNLENFHNDWKNLENPADFKKLLSKYGLSRWQAVHHAPDGFFAQKILNRKIVNLIEEVNETQLVVSILSANNCCSINYTGKIEKVSFHESWFNAFGSNSGFHLNTSKIIESRIIRKPSNAGIISSAECYDRNYELIFEIFNHRDDDTPELNEWRALLNQFETSV